MSERWVGYNNGNYKVMFNLSDGTKIRYLKDDNADFIPSFAENMDVKITDRCDGACEFCYEGCTTKGKHAELMNAKWVDTLHPYTELAINGNDLSHPQLIPFLTKLREKKITANMTVNQIHFKKYKNYIDSMLDNKLIHGLGISLRNPDDEFINLVKQYPNAVIHVINGICSPEQFEKLADNNLKILILGYKELQRGIDYLNANRTQIETYKQWTKDNLSSLIKRFNVISFDNLALEQLNVKYIMTRKHWEQFFMGADGQYTFYIDMVKGEFAKNSLAQERFPIMDNADNMFKFIVEKYR